MLGLRKVKKIKKSEGIKAEEVKNKIKDGVLFDDIVIANLEMISSTVTPYGPVLEKMNLKHLLTKVDGVDKYREIFTGLYFDCAGTNSYYFDYPYVVKPVKATSLFPEYIGVHFNKLDLIYFLDYINKQEEVKEEVFTFEEDFVEEEPKVYKLNEGLSVKTEKEYIKRRTRARNHNKKSIIIN